MGKRKSKSFSNKKRLITLGLVAGYLFCVIFGAYLIWAISFYKNKDALLEISTSKGNQVLSAGQIDEVTIYGMEHWLIDETGQLISNQPAFLHHSQTEHILSFHSLVFEQHEAFTPCFFMLDNSEEDPIRVFGIVAGTIVENTCGQRFASILLRDLPDLDTAMTIFVALFSFVYLIGILFTVLTIRKERELNQMRQDLIANVSHELKTPITSIRAMTEVLHDGILKDHTARQDFCVKIISEADRLEQLVLDILELSRLQSNRAEFQKNTTFAQELFPPIMDRYMMLCGDLGVHLDTSELHIKDIPLLYTDMDKIITLIETLMDNAVKFTGKGGTIWVSNQIHAKYTTFCIRDNGPGIRAEDVPRVFERFYKADIAHNSSGSGLGLAIAEEIARGLGEKIWLESEYGKGTSFCFTISYLPRRN